jgi:hypothetical protein
MVGFGYRTTGLTTTPIVKAPTIVVTGWLEIVLIFKIFTKKDML